MQQFVRHHAAPQDAGGQFAFILEKLAEAGGKGAAIAAGALVDHQQVALGQGRLAEHGLVGRQLTLDQFHEDGALRPVAPAHDQFEFDAACLELLRVRGAQEERVVDHLAP